MPSVREYLRTLVTGNGSEVVLPWFPEANTKSREMRMIRNSRIEPRGSNWIHYPLAFILWTALSLVTTIKMGCRHGADIRDRTKLTIYKQFLQMLYLAWYKNLSPQDYYSSFMYRKEYRKDAEFYIPGHRQGRLSRQLNEGRPTERLDHKVKAYHTLKRAGLPTVDIVEVFHADGHREFSRTDEALSGYLGRDFFVKPANMYMGMNACRWIYDPVTNMYSDGKRVVPSKNLWITISEEARELGQNNPEREARLVQPLLRNHPDIASFSKNSLNTVRVITMCFSDGRIRIYDVNFRMAYGESVADTGALIAASVNQETGRLHAGRSTLFPTQVLTRHPTTNVQIEGRKIPFLKKIISLAREAQEAFPENPIVGWDIAVTPEGPLIVEANCNSNLSAVQCKTRQPLTHSLYADLY